MEMILKVSDEEDEETEDIAWGEYVDLKDEEKNKEWELGLYEVYVPRPLLEAAKFEPELGEEARMEQERWRRLEMRAKENTVKSKA